MPLLPGSGSRIRRPSLLPEGGFGIGNLVIASGKRAGSQELHDSCWERNAHYQRKQIPSGHDGIKNRRRDKNGQRENISDELFQDISFAGE